MTERKYLTKQEIEDIIDSPLTDEEILSCRKNNLLVPTFDNIFEGAVSPGSPKFKVRGDDREIMDCTSQAWVLSLGHAPPDPVYAAYYQAQKMNHHQYGFLDTTRAKLAMKIAEIGPGKLKDGKVAFNNMGGAAANEAAIRLAMISQRQPIKPQVVVFSRGYHGSTLALTGGTQQIKIATRYRPFGLDRWERGTYPYCYRCPFGYKEGFNGKKDKSCNLECLKFFKDFVETNTRGNVGAILMEPMQGAGGQIPAPVEFLRGMKKICKKDKISMIYDEFQTGIGRTGYMFATDYYNADGGEDVSPDIMTLAKGAAAGFPLGITLAKKKFKGFSEAEEHSTFSSTPVSMAASLVTLEIMQKFKIPENARKQGDYITKRLHEMKEKYPVIGDIRGPGLFIGIEFVKDPESKKPHNELHDLVKSEGWKQGLYLQGMMPIIRPSAEMMRNVIKIKPPLNISDEDAEFICDKFEVSLKSALDLVRK